MAFAARAAVGGALLALLTLALPANVAHAQERNQIDTTVSPKTVTAGAMVHITAQCGTSQATATSRAFPDQTLKSSTGGTVEGDVAVDPGTPVGTWPVSVLCTNSSNFGEAELTVVDNTGVQTGDGSSLDRRSAASSGLGSGDITT